MDLVVGSEEFLAIKPLHSFSNHVSHTLPFISGIVNYFLYKPEATKNSRYISWVYELCYHSFVVYVHTVTKGKITSQSAT